MGFLPNGWCVDINSTPASPPFAPRSRLQPLSSQMDGLLGADGMSPNNGDPERQHRHVTPGSGSAQRRTTAALGSDGLII